MPTSDQIIEACEKDDVSAMAEYIERVSQLSEGKRQDVLNLTLRRAVKRHAAKITAHVMELGADHSRIDGGTIASEIDYAPNPPTREIVETLIAHGWDISQGEVPLLWVITDDYDWVAWCLAHKAKVMPQDEDVSKPRAAGPTHFTLRNPILQYPARNGDIATFELLRAHGAPVSQAVLPSAVRKASRLASRDSTEQPSEKYKKLLSMVVYLLDVVKIDVNIPSFGVAAGVGSGSYCSNPLCSTPLCCVADSSTGDTQELVWVLLDRGGDPNLCVKYQTGIDFSIENSVPSAIEAHPKNERFRQAVIDWEAKKHITAS